MTSSSADNVGKCFLCSRTIWRDDPTTTAAGLSVHRACYDKFVKPSLLPDTPRTSSADTQ